MTVPAGGNGRISRIAARKPHQRGHGTSDRAGPTAWSSPKTRTGREIRLKFVQNRRYLLDLSCPRGALNPVGSPHKEHKRT